MAESWLSQPSLDDTPPTIVVVTASNEKQAAAVEQELKFRRQSGAYGENTIFFAVPDPSSARVGSGGATFNALITVQELVSSYARFNVESCRIFMIHSGGDSQRLPCQSVCGKAWSALPTYSSSFELNAPIDLLLEAMFKLFKNVRTGLVVASSDVLLLIPKDFPCHWPSTGATGLAIPTDKHIGPNHGVYHTELTPADGGANPEGRFVRKVNKFFQKASVEEMQAAGAVRSADQTVLIDSGVIYFSLPATLTLLNLARTYPLDCCTYLGLDMNRKPLRIELYSDIMMAMGGGMGLTKDDYHKVATSDTQSARIATSRDILWAALIDMPFYACVVEGGHFSHVGTTSEYLQLLAAPTDIQRQYGLKTSAAWYEFGRPVQSMGGCFEDPVKDEKAPRFTVLNSLFHGGGIRGVGAVVEHSELSGDWAVGPGSLVSSMRSVKHLTLRQAIAAQEMRVSGGKQRVITVLGVLDPIKDPYTKSSARICGAKWSDFFEATGTTAEDIWPDLSDPSSMTIWTAKLFPVADVVNGGSGSTIGQVDEVTSDRASLMLQWLDSVSINCESTGLDAKQHEIVRRGHLQPKVISAWRTLPRLSLKEILGEADATTEFAWRRELRGKIDAHLLVGAITNMTEGDSPHRVGLPVFDLVRRLGRSAVPVSIADVGISGENASPVSFAIAALRGLDHIALSSSPDVAGRALAVQSALLWAMAGWGSHGHRSGPAHNDAWLNSFALLDGGFVSGTSESPDVTSKRNSNRSAAIRAMAALRDQWIHRSHLIGRAARHYERASQLLTAQCVYTAPVLPPRSLSPLESTGGASAAANAVGKWVVATCPVRLDLAGGWSDTPPITFEAEPDFKSSLNSPSSEGSLLSDLTKLSTRGGGVVVNVSVNVSGARPLGTRARLLPVVAKTGETAPAPSVTIRTRASEAGGSLVGGSVGADGAPGVIASSLEITSVSDLSDFNQPHAEGALAKCALLLLGVVRLPPASTSGKTIAWPDLGEQLSSSVGATKDGVSWKLEIETWSLVPQGSGLGTSSILAGTLLAAVAGALGREYDRVSLVHMVLKLEQMLSTGGGWQDQVGGLWPGVKVSSCGPSLPVSVSVSRLSGGPDLGKAISGYSTEVIQHSPSVVSPLHSFLDSHLFLVYTGQTRLAKNLLQRVLRQWAVRENQITQTVSNLRSTAVSMSMALSSRDPEAVGAALNAYWDQKKRMAPMAEPASVTAMLAAIRPHIFGASLCGAGGGGFLVGVSKEPRAQALIERVLKADAGFSALSLGSQWKVLECTVDEKGLVIEII